MNKRRFIERLNLYLDDELSSEEADKLLNSIRRNPEYHRIYMQYCQIHNACSQLGASFSEERPKQSWRQKAYAVSGMAAAVALLGLAAQNIAPMLDPTNGRESLEMNLSQSTTQMPEETFVVLDVNALEGMRLLVNSFEIESFDIEKAFDAVEPSGVEFANFGGPRFVDAKPERSVAMNNIQKEFSFSEAVNASTFEHEVLVAKGEMLNALSNATPTVVIEGEDGSRFNFGKAANFKLVENVRTSSLIEKN